MTRMRNLASGMCALLAVILAGGCDSAKDMQIETLQQQVNELERSNHDLQTQLAAAMSDADDARRWAAQLQQELADARQQLAEVGTLPKGWMEEGGVAWTDIADDILFDSGKAKLKSTGRARLQEVVQVIQEQLADREVWVVGHTDSDPIKHSPWKDNLELSLNRARTVALELYKMGLDPKHVIPGGQGEFNPIASNTTDAGKAKNRRVQIMAVVRGGAESAAVSPVTSEPDETLSPAESVPPEK